MVWTNIISQNKYIFPHIFLPHFNLSREVSISYLCHGYGKNKLKIMKGLLRKANIVFWILCKAFCWCIYLKEFHFLLSFCSWTHRDFDRYVLRYTITKLNWVIQNFQRQLERMAYRKVEPAVPFLAMLAYAWEPDSHTAAALLPLINILRWLSLITTYVWGSEKQTAVVCWEYRRAQRLFVSPPQHCCNHTMTWIVYPSSQEKYGLFPL